MPVFDGKPDLCAYFVPDQSPYVIIDLEYTSWEGTHGRLWGGSDEYREIIDIGAILVDPTTNSILEELQIFSRPTINPALSPYISELTGISQLDIDTKGVPYETAHNNLFAFIGDEKLVYFNGWDGSVIRENALLNNLTVSDEQYSRLLNLRPMLSRDMGVAEDTIVSSELSEDHTLTAHRAVDDAKKIFQYLSRRRHAA